MKKINVGIIGATGSIGKSALEVILKFKELFNITFLVAESNYKLLAKYAKETKAKNIAIADIKQFTSLKTECDEANIVSNVVCGKEAILSLIKEPNQVILVANNGIAALDYILQCIYNNQTIILANKEALVCAGKIINDSLKNSNAKIIPADSEHNAIYQILNQEYKKDFIAEIVLTASGGPFYNHSEEELQHITKKEAIKHPNWSMGEIISVNSATLVNKALEIIEAYYLFNLDVNKINAVYHPQSLIHGIVKYIDGSLNMIAYKPSMQIALSYALSPKIRLNLPDFHVSVYSLNNIIIEEIKPSKLKPISIAKQVLSSQGNAPCIFNVANEIAVNAFLLGKINFLSIIKVIEYCLNKIPYNNINNISDIYKEAGIIKNIAAKYINSLS